MQRIRPNSATGVEIIITDFDGSQFVGTVKDDEQTGGAPGIGVINGTIQNSRIDFIKEMPVRTSYLPTGERVEEEGETHLKIYYSGLLSMEQREA